MAAELQCNELQQELTHQRVKIDSEISLLSQVSQEVLILKD